MQHWPYRMVGDPDLPRLVFLHGFLGRGADWESIAAGLADRYCCVLPDLPGHGANTSLPVDTTLGYESMSRGLSDMLASLGPEPVGLVGYSLGGRIALYSALRYPRLARALVLESANPGIAEPEARRQRLAADGRQAERIRAEGLRGFVKGWYDQALFQSLRERPALLEELRRAKLENDPTWMEKVLCELSPGCQPYLGERWQELHIPVLLLSGALDEKYSALARAAASSNPGLQARIVPRAGHIIHAERPARFGQILGAFLDSLES